MKITLRIECVSRPDAGEKAYAACVLGNANPATGARKRLCLPDALACGSDERDLLLRATSHLMAFGFALEDIQVERR